MILLVSSASLGVGVVHYPVGESARLSLLCVPLPVLGNGCGVFPCASQSEDPAGYG